MGYNFVDIYGIYWNFASAKFQTTMCAFHNLTLVSNYQTLYLNVITVNVH